MLQVTEPAAKKIQSMLSRRGSGLGIRLGVKTTGCSGLAYVLEYVDAPQTGDEHFESAGCQIFVDPKRGVVLQGLTVDYVRKGLQEGFEFLNPNERDRCGCGESFRI
jgi:iron-sulfur cluster assembly protein